MLKSLRELNINKSPQKENKGELKNRVSFFVSSRRRLLGIILSFFLLSLNLVWGEEIDLHIIAIIESNGNELAYNQKTQARGLYQITPICLEDFNRWNGEGLKYIKDDIYNYIRASVVADWYLNIRIPQLLKHYNKPITIETILWCYNAGIGNLLKGIMPKETRNYIKRYNQLSKLK